MVMGDQKDGLRGLTRFSDNEGDIIWPAWRAELKQRVAFEFGKIGNQITGGEVKESDADHQGGQRAHQRAHPEDESPDPNSERLGGRIRH